MKIEMPLYLSFILFFLACSKGPKESPGPAQEPSVKTKADSVPSSSYDLSLLDKSTLFAESPVVTDLQDQAHLELSGIAPSRTYSGILYMHEDSGNANEVYVSNAAGADLGKIVLDGIGNRDWEDLATGPGPDNSKSYLYVGEIGDNDSVYPDISVYRFAEPDMSGSTASTVKHVTAERIRLAYPKGAVNAESLLVDPLTRDIYIFTKENSKSTLYVARYPQSVPAVTTLVPLATLPFNLLVSGDISADGSEILLRSTGHVWYWKRTATETIAQTVLRKPQDAPYAGNEHQGEGICFSADAGGYFTNTETKKFPGDKVAISFYKRK